MAFSIPLDFVYNAFYFSFYAGYTPFIMFRPVYFKYIGLNPAFVGLLSGCRFVLQSAGTPVLIIVAERLRSRKLLFVISYLVLMIKLLIIFIVLRPRNQVCVIKHLGDQSKQRSYVVHHVLSRRNLLQADDSWNETAEDASILWNMPVVRKELTVQKTELPSVAVTQDITDISPTSGPSTVSNYSRSVEENSVANTVEFSEKHNASKVSTTPKDPDVTEYIIYNDKNELFRIFICLLILILLSDAFDSTMFMLVEESCVVNADAEHYGQAQTCGVFGWGVIVPNIGLIIYYCNQEFCGQYIGSFHYVFYFAFGFLTMAFFCGLCLDFSNSKRDVLTRKVPGPLSTFQYSTFTFASMYSGFCNGFLLSFTYWFIDTLGGSAVIMGLTTGCRAACNIIVSVVITRLVEHIGHQLIVDVGLVCHIVVFVVYFAIKWPLLVLLAEMLFATTHVAVTRTCSLFLQSKAPTGSSPKMQGISQEIYLGLGTGCGAILGGFYLEYSGFVRTFLGFSIITSIVCIVFLFLQILFHLFNPESNLDDIWTVWSVNSSCPPSEYEGSDEESDDL